MKKQKLIFLKIMILMFISGKLLSQATFTSMPERLTPKGIFDTLFDGHGKKYALSTLNLRSARPLGGTNTISSVPSVSCSAGYFDLYFDPNSVMFSTGSQSAQAQSVICQVFRDISGFINSPLASGTNTVRINIFCDDVPTSAFLGLATSFYMFPGNATNNNQGVIDGLIYKTLTSGIDPYSMIPISTFTSSGGNSFYHGNVKAYPLTTWNFATSTNTMNIGEYDFYTVMLHEAMHSLGFLSLIGPNGLSNLTGLNSSSYYSRYDQFLKDYNGVPLLTSTSGTTCPNSNLVFNALLTPSLTFGSANCINSGTNINVTNCSVAVTYSSANVFSAVYTPFCFEAGSSLSHFEDMCTYGTFTSVCTPTPATPGYNDLYFLMSNANGTGNCFIKRHMQEEERQVLCDLGYSVSTTFTSNAAAASHTYNSACLPTATIIGMNDGYNGSAYTYTTSTNSLTISIASILGNDIPSSGLQVSCFEVVYNNATVTAGAGNLTVTATPGTGIVLLKYYPLSSSGQYGNATYIFTYFIPTGCGSPGSCNMVQNAGFESLAVPSPSCGYISSNQVQLSCWEPYLNTSVISGSNCSAYSYYTGLTTFNNAAGNNNVLELIANSNALNTQSSMKNSLGSPLIPGQPYRISFWALNLTNGAFGSTTNVNNRPAIVTIASNPSFAFTPTVNFPTGLNFQTQFTVNCSSVWAQYTKTFVCTGSGSGESALLIGLNPITSASITGTDQLFCLIDNVNLEPIPSPTFIINQGNTCSNIIFTNLAQYASTVTGTSLFSGTGVSFSSGQYDFNASGTLSPGIYPIAFTYTNGSCSNTLWQNIIISNSISLTTSGTSTYCANTATSISISASQTGTIPGISYDWQPGSLTGTAQVVSPTATTIYTITASVGSCFVTQTLGINVFYNCCGSNTIAAFPYSSPLSGLGTTYSGPTMVMTNQSIASGANIILNGEFIMANNTQITVAGGGTLQILGGHLYSCSANMWNGIVVQNNGVLQIGSDAFTGRHSLIEDAITAIDVSTYSTSTNTSVLSLSNTTFNKNYVDINIDSYQRSSNSYSNAFSISSCVFSCRNFTFNSTTWPQTSGSDLRAATSSTTGLASPYGLQSASITPLKSPYAGQYASIAILLSNTGITSGSNFYAVTLGNTTAGEFNLFDAHYTFVSALNSNLTCRNNVFQNTLFTGTVSPGNGTAIYHVTTSGTVNSLLDMNAGSVSTSNHFWNCHRGVEGRNIFRLFTNNAIFRSTQSTTNTAFAAGNTGMVLNTNRFQYYIYDNEFTNINTCINIPIVTGQGVKAPATCSLCLAYDIIAANIAVHNNTFSPGSGTNNYVDMAVNITAPNNASWYLSPNGNVTPYIRGAVVDYNTMDRVYRGINMNGLMGFQGAANNNNITLTEDVTKSLAQHGIELSNCFATANSFGKSTIVGNNISSVGTGSLSNNLVSLVYCGNNMGPGLLSPSVACNDASNSYNGFVFDAPNQGTQWMGNRMQSLNKGMYLVNNGVIGQQGNASLGIGNQWNGTWSSGVYGIYTYSSSAVSSPLWVAGSSAPSFPPNLNGFPNPISYANSAFAPNVVTTYNDYGCETSNTFVAPDPLIPNAEDYDDNAFYMANTALYRFLHLNDSITVSSSSLSAYYGSLAGSSIDVFMQIEDSLEKGNLAYAATLNSGITPTNSIEGNYQAYYTLYISYASSHFEPTTPDDESNLANLAALCPGTDGACVYQARALYNAVFSNAPDYPVCSGSGARLAHYDAQKDNNHWQISLYPNPASSKITLTSNTENDNLNIVIHDLSGRTLLDKTIKLSGFMVNLDLNLINGAYLVIVTNSNHEQLIKKLLISK